MKNPSFVLDVHLAKLARHLRMVGLDAHWRPEDDALPAGEGDRELLALATAEGRVLLTRDRALFEAAPPELRHYVAATEPEAQLREILSRYSLWEFARSFRGFLKRCLECNALILPVKGHQLVDRLPGKVRLEHDEFFLCPRCERVYWNGSHVDRMKAWLSRLTPEAMALPALRPATTTDIAALVALVNSAYRGEVSRQGWTTEADLLGGQRVDAAMVDELLRDPETAVLVLDEAGAGGSGLLGCVELKRKGAEDAYLGMLTVAPSRQAGGVGRRLLESAEAWVRRTWGTTRIEMTVIAQRGELIAWYRRRGYTVTELRQAFPYGDARFGLPLREDLEFVVLEKRFVK